MARTWEVCRLDQWIIAGIATYAGLNAGILTFIGSLEIETHRVSFDDLPFYQFGCKKMDFENIEDGYFLYGGDKVFLADISVLFDERLFSDLLQTLGQAIKDAAEGNFNWGSEIFDLLLGMLEMFMWPPPGTSPQIKYGMKMASKIVDFISKYIASNETMSAAEKQAAIYYLASAIAALGGRFAYVNAPPDKFIMTGYTFETQEAAIKLAGLHHDLNISEAEAMLILMDVNHVKYSKTEYNRVYDYVNGGYTTYRGELAAEFDKDEYREKYPDLPRSTQIDELPLEVLQDLIIAVE